MSHARCDVADYTMPAVVNAPQMSRHAVSVDNEEIITVMAESFAFYYV